MVILILLSFHCFPFEALTVFLFHRRCYEGETMSADTAAQAAEVTEVLTSPS